MSGKARQATLGGFVKGSKQKEAVLASDSGAPELDPAQANKSGPQLESDSAQASVEGPLATLNTAESLNLSNGPYQSLRLCDPGCLEQPNLFTI